jgi:hypothetical protein
MYRTVSIMQASKETVCADHNTSLDQEDGTCNGIQALFLSDSKVQLILRIAKIQCAEEPHALQH